jgi:UDP-N-acetylglucosamine diphosphorylase / glucose-1-phosphate thymidylyltransferase / UDP-N-acetylgalactosamine diphosphorylase / glucosamine-1-phosphate N-acetyltransferase / galactosamine-1-phosphate N-acetyltransferase
MCLTELALFVKRKHSICGRSSVGRAPPCQGGCRGFESLRPLQITLKASDLFAFPSSLPFSTDFLPELSPWDWVKLIRKALRSRSFGSGKLISEIPQGFKVGSLVYLHPTVKLPAHGSIIGPAYISENCEIRPGAYIRENVIVGKNCVLGNSCEFKNALLLNGVQTPHFNYVGDSVLGNRVHLGAGVILANLRFDQSEVMVSTPMGKRGTGLRKLGALIGDDAEIGCNATLMPGSILGKESKVGPLSSFSGRL